MSPPGVAVDFATVTLVAHRPRARVYLEAFYRSVQTLTKVTECLTTSPAVHGTDQWSVSAGVRYTDELKSNLFQHVNEIPFESVVVPFPKGLSSARWDYNGSINFQAAKDILFYGSVATGFRSPGFNPRIFTAGQLQEVPGEKAIQYEIGNKSDFFEHRLRANTAFSPSTINRT